MAIRLWPLLITLSCLATWARADLPPALTHVLRQARVPESSIGLLIQPLEGGPVEVTHNADQAFNPASLMKLLTTLAALDSLGPSYVWTTRVLVDGEVSEGVLHGDLILQGSGDPALTPERFWALLHEVRQRGLREIRGDVIIDNSLYAIDMPDPGAFDQAPLKTYNANPAAFLINYNAVNLRLTPLGGTVQARIEPPGLPVESSLELDRHSACEAWRDAIETWRDGDIVRVSGRYPESCGERAMWLNLSCPAATAATWFKSLWADAGGVVTGQMRLGTTPASARPWVEQESPPLSLIVRDINKYSNNVMAKMLFLQLGLARQGAPATWEKGQGALLAWLASRGLEFPELVIDNGSGLSRAERITAVSLARLLTWAARQPIYYDFAASLPTLGQDGTQRRRLKDSPLRGRAWLKSGSLNGVRNLAGYFMDAAGQRKLFILFIRHSDHQQAALAQDGILEWALTRSETPGSAYPSASGR
jgi:D-alanyl-D-alanine carboxypeptidase/D-alanyl-D-alanine-endopeptidase (penicillin-binding protein 4)